MHLFKKRKDGGSKSPVDAYFLFEIKGLFSIALLKFNKGGREAFHTHAFNALTWFVSGEMEEQTIDEAALRSYGEKEAYSANGSRPVEKVEVKKYKRSWLPKLTKRSTFHRVLATKVSWCITFRGPWADSWQEYNQSDLSIVTFKHGRKIAEVQCL